MSAQIRWLGSAVDTYNQGADEYNKAAKEYNQYKSYVDKGQNVWQACHKDVEKTGQTREALAHCMEVSVGEAAEILCVELGPAAKFCKSVAGPIGKKVGEILYDIGSWLGLTNAEEEARLHAQQAAAWAQWQQVGSNVEQAYKRAQGSLELAIEGVMAVDRDLGLSSSRGSVLATFELSGLTLVDGGAPNYWWDPCRASVTVSPGSSSIDASKVVTGAWKLPCAGAMATYAKWQEQLKKVVIAYGIQASLQASRRAKQQQKRSNTLLLVGVAGAAAAWWLLPKGFFSKLLK